MTAGLATAAWVGLRARAGTLGMGERPTAPLPDTRLALAAAFALWAPAQVAMGVWFGISGAVPAERLLAATLVHVVIAFAVLRIALGGPRSGIPPRREVAAGLVGGLAVYGVVALVSIGLVVAYRAAGTTVPEQGVVEMLRAAEPGARVLMAACTVLLAPFAEEVFYRGILLPALAHRMPVGSALVVQALVFGFVHFWMVPAAWPLTLAIAVVGWGAGWLYVRTGSLAAAVVLHATFNGIQLALLFASL